MRAALGGGDDVDEAAHRRLVAVAPLEREIDDHLALDLLRRHVPLGVEHRNRLVKVPDAVQPDRLGHGLVGVRERVKIYGGEMSAGAANGGGFVLTTRLPLSGDQP